MEAIDIASGGVVLCDTTIDLIGAPFTGHCSDCDWAFDVEATVVSEKGSSCAYELYQPEHTFLTDPYSGLVDTYFGFADYYNYSSRYPLYDVAFFGGYYSTPYFSFWTWRNLVAGDSWLETYKAKTGGLDLRWYTSTGYGKNYYPSYCGDYGSYMFYSASTAYYGASTLNCGGNTMYDVWSFYAGAGSGSGSPYAWISADTVAADTAFDLRLRILDSSLCEVGFADDQFACTYAPTAWICPGYKLSLTPKSTYYVMVQSMGSCTGTSAEYELYVETDGSDPMLSLVTDDHNMWTTIVTSTGWAHAPVP
jgi:hypothetical protein